MTKRIGQPLILWALVVILGLLGLVGCASEDDPPEPTEPLRPYTTIPNSDELPALLPGSCSEHCGSYRPGSCQCDPSCLEYRDCCKDYVDSCDPQPAPTRSCMERCGEATTGAGCQCDAACVVAGDCCTDLEAACLVQSWYTPQCPEGTAADMYGDCTTAVCAAPVLQAGRLWRVTSMTVLPKEGGCDLDDDGKPDNAFGKLISLWKEIGPDTKKYVEDNGLALVFRDCAKNPAAPRGYPHDCKSPLGWLPVPVSATTQLPMTLHPGVWLGTKAGPACPARIQVSKNYYALATSAPLWLPLLPFGGTPAVHIPVHSAAYRSDDPDGVVLCGIVDRLQLALAIHSLPADLLQPYGGTEKFASLAFSILAPDIDTDDNGKKDAISIAVQIEWEPFDPKDAILLSTGLSTPVSQTEVP